MAGFCKSATTAEISAHGHVLTPGRYVGAEEVENDGDPFEEKMPRLVAELHAEPALRSFSEEGFAESAKLEQAINRKWGQVSRINIQSEFAVIMKRQARRKSHVNGVLAESISGLMPSNPRGNSPRRNVPVASEVAQNSTNSAVAGAIRRTQRVIRWLRVRICRRVPWGESMARLRQIRGIPP